MPTYEFLCENCQAITEKKLPITSTIRVIPCEHCYSMTRNEGGEYTYGGIANRIISRTSFVLRGSGWSNQYKPNTSAGSEDDKKNPHYNSPEFLSS